MASKEINSIRSITVPALEVSDLAEVGPAHGTGHRVLRPPPDTSRMEMVHLVAFEYNDALVRLIGHETYFAILVACDLLREALAVQVLL